MTNKLIHRFTNWPIDRLGNILVYQLEGIAYARLVASETWGNVRICLQEVMILKLNYKIWIEKDGEKVFGDGPLDILHRVERTGSLRQAAEEINMSYSLAWNLIKDLEKRLRFNLLKRSVGGERGGGSEITQEARELMTKFKLFREGADQNLNSLYKKIFKEKD